MGSKVELPELYEALNISHLFQQSTPQKTVFLNTTLSPRYCKTAV